MKPLIYSLLLAGICSQAQIVSPGADGDYRRAATLYRDGNYRGALAQLEDTRSAEGMLLQAQSLFASGDYVLASAVYDAIVQSYPATPQAFAAAVGSADCLYGQGHYARALEKYQNIDSEQMAPADYAAYAYRCGICAYNENLFDQATAYFEASAREASTRSASNYYLGVIAFARKDYDLASRYFSQTNHSVEPGRHAPYYLAQIDFIEGRWAKALAQARQLLHDCPPDMLPQMQRIAGESMVRLGRKDEGIAMLRKYLASDGTHAPSALFLVGVADFEAGDYSAAIERLRPVTQADDPMLEQAAYLYIGQSQMHTGEKDAALMSFEKATQVNNGDPQVEEAAYYNYAVAKFSGASIPFKSSVETFEQFLRQYPSGPYSERVAEYLADGYLNEGYYDTAISRIDAVARPSETMLRTKLRALYALARQEQQAGNYDEALSNLNKTEAFERYDAPTALEAKLLKAMILSRRGEYRSATPLFRSYLDKAPRNATNRAMASYGMGYALYNQKDIAGATRAFRSALPTLDTKTQADAYNRLGDLAQAQADYSQATAYYQKALEGGAAPDYSALQIARMQGFRHDYQGKLDALTRYLTTYPSSPLLPDALLEMTQAQISLGRNTDAVATYRRLIAEYPATAQGRRGYLEMAMTLLDMKRRAEAIDAYRSVISLYPSSEEAAQAAALLKNLYVDAGHADEYIAFIKSVEHAPQLDAAETESLAYTSALNSYNASGNTAQIETFVDRYPDSRHRAELLGILLDNAEGEHATALADEIIERYPDSRVAERALAVKAAALYSAGSIPEALALYKELKSRASGSHTIIEASLGIMRCARDMGDNEVAAQEADNLIGGSIEGVDDSTLAEAQFTKASALEAQGKVEEAIELWQRGAANPSDIYGAKSAYRAAEALFESGKTAKALAAAQKFVKSGSRQHYWVARGFILLSDIYKAQGNKYEARQYLEALRDNYPGNETDIKMMIESRLAEN